MDDTDARSLINAEFIVNQLIGADDDLRARLVEDLAGAFSASQRAYTQSDVNQSKVTRILQSGSPITTDTAGLTKDLSNKSLFKTFDFRGQTVQIDPNNHEIARILGGSGSDCLFDYLVSTCAASLSGFVEGQTFTSLSGCPFKMYSTLSGMQTAVQTAGVAATVAICGGTYAETWTINGTALSGKRVSYYGASSSKVTVQATVLTGGAFADSKGLTLKEIRFTTCDFSGADSTWFEDCIFDAATFLTPGAGMTDTHFKNCDFTGSFTGGSITQWATCSFENCMVTGSVLNTNYNTGPLRIIGCNIGGGIDLGTGTNIEIKDNAVGGSVNSGANAIRVANCDGLQINNNTITSSPTGATIQLAESSGRNWGFQINDNNFAANTNGYLGTSAANKEVLWGTFQGNVFHTNGGAAVKAIHATANFGYVTFGPNGPDIMDYSSVVTTSGGNAYYTGGTVPSGAVPVGAALVTKDDGSTIVAVTQSLDFRSGLSAVLNGTTEAQLALGNLTVDWTQAAAGFDISQAGNLTVLKHVAAGVSAAIDATAILSFLETKTTAALGAVSDYSAIKGTVSLTQSAATAIPVFGMQIAASMTGNFTATAGNEVTGAIFTTSITGGADTPLMYGVKLKASSGNGASVVTDRYGLYVADATGSGVFTNQYAVYIEALAKGGTLNAAIRSLGGQSRHVGSVSIGADSTPNASAILDLSNAANLAMLLPQVATASLPTPVNGEMVYDSTTNTTKAYAGSQYYNLTHLHEVVMKVDGSITTQKTGARVPVAGTITNVTCKTDDGVTVGATAWIGTIYKVPVASIDTDGGTTEIFTTRPTIPNTHMAQNYGAPDLTTAVAAGDWLFAATIQAGSVTSGTPITLAVEIRY